MKKFIVFLAVISVAAGIGLFFLKGIGSETTYRGTVCQQVERAIRGTEAEIRNQRQQYKADALQDQLAELNYRKQELAACQDVNLDKAETPASGDQSPTASPSPSASSTPSEGASAPTPTASATPTQAPNAGPANQVNPRQWEYLANRPPIQKSSVNAFGPRDGLKVNKSLADMTTDEALTELRYRMTVDPMLASATGAALGLWSYNEVDAKTKLFADNFAKWDKATADIERKLDEAVKAGKVRIVKLEGVYTASYAIPGDVPSVRTDMNISRNEQTALEVDGKLFQLHCGFQEYWKQQAPQEQAPKKDQAQAKSAAPAGTKPMPAPSPGMTRTSEGTPVREYVTPPKSTNPPSKPPRTTKPPTVPPTTQPPTTRPPTTTKPPTTQPPTKAVKDPSKDPAPNGNAGNGGGRNQDPGPGPYVPPANMTRPPTTTRTNPPAPTATKTQQPTTTKPAPPPESQAPKPSNPATGCAPAPGRSC